MLKASRRVPPASASSKPIHPPALAARTPASLPPIAALIAAPAGIFPARDPAAYAMELDGDCLAPDVTHGSVAIMSPAAPLTRGGYVALHFRDSRTPQIKRLVNLPPSPVLAALGRPGANVAGLVLVEMLSPPRLLSYRSTELAAVHAVVEIVRPEHVQVRRAATDVAAAAAAGVAS